MQLLSCIRSSQSNPLGMPKTTEVVQGRTFCGSEIVKSQFGSGWLKRETGPRAWL